MWFRGIFLTLQEVEHFNQKYFTIVFQLLFIAAFKIVFYFVRLDVRCIRVRQLCVEFLEGPG